MDLDARALIIQTSNTLADLVDGRVHLMTSPSEFAHRQFGAAALVRGCDLLRSSIVCLEAGQQETVGVLTRAIQEAWFTGTFAMFGGRPAIIRLEAERQRNMRLMADSNKLNADAVLDDQKDDLHLVAVEAGHPLGPDGKPKFDRLPVFRIASELGAMIEASPYETEDSLAVYNMMYRSYSSFDAHGLDPLDRRIDFSDGALVTLREPIPWIDPHASILLSAMMLVTLGGWVFGECGIARIELNGVRSTLVELGMDAHDHAFDGAPQEVLDALPDGWLDGHKQH